MEDKLVVIIPAAGLGRRMKSYGPKSLIDLGGQLVITRQLNLLRERFPAAEFILVLGFEAEKVLRIIPPYVRVVENECYEDTNVARSISMGLHATSEANKILIVYGDLVFNKQTLEVPLNESMVIIDTKKQMREFEVGLTTINGNATQFSYGLPTKWAQMVYLTGKELRLFKESMLDKDHRRYYGFEVLNLILEHGGRFKAIEPAGMRIAEIDTSRDIDTAKLLVKE